MTDIGHMAALNLNGKGTEKATVQAAGEHDDASGFDDQDVMALARSGKKQVLKRRFGLFSMTGLVCAMMISWQGSIVNLSLGLHNGGPAGLLWGTLLVWIGMLSVFVSMGELASMAPTAAGQYHWTNLLAPRAFKIPFSYIVGWVTVITWIAVTTAASYIAATMMQQLIKFAIQYDPQPYQGTLIMWGVLLITVLLNTAMGGILPLIDYTFLALFILGFFAILIPLVSLGSRGDAHEIFTRFENGGGWPSNGVAFLVGIQGAVGAFMGTDCAIHMSEEVEKSEVNVANSMVLAVILNGVLAFCMLVAFLLYAGPIDALLASDNQYPFMDVIYNATGSKTAVYVLTSYIIVMLLASATSGVSGGSRMVWSFARDRGLPFSRFISKVDRRSRLPIVAVFVVFTCAALLGCIQIGSSVAFQDLISLGVEGFCTSYLGVIALLLYHRLAGNIVVAAPPSKSSTDVESGPVTADGKLVWGPWRVPGLLGTLNNAIACGFLVVFAFFSFWPPTRSVDAKSMNYSSAVLGGVMLLSMVYYALRARRTYHGPIVEVRA